MNLIQTILLSLNVGVLIIGFHQTYLHGFIQSYWIFMVVIILYSIFRLVKAKTEGKTGTGN